MGKPTGFLEYSRQGNPGQPPLERIRHWDEFHAMLPEEERRRQAARCMECGVPFCQSGVELGGMVIGCPLHNLAPEWNDLIYTGNLDQALARLTKTNSFPEFTGRVCPALCEAACTCGLSGDPVTVKENELAIIEAGFASGAIRPRPPKVRTGKRVAVVGSGPTGLAAAQQLNRRGHAVTIFEREDRAGGLLMYGIPNMKLQKEIVARRTGLMAAEGVVFRTSCDVGRDVSARQLLDEYDAVIVGSPVYYAGPAGQLCAFLDRLFYCGGGRMAGKLAASVVSCRRGGASAAFDRLNKYFGISNMHIVGSQYWNQVHGNAPDEVRRDEEGLQTMRTLAQNMAWLLKCIELGKQNGIPAPENKKVLTNFIR